MNIEIKEKLEKLAIKKSIPFCYSCYQEARSGKCQSCGSDDLARLVPSVGMDWNLEWIITHILETELTPVNSNEAFEESVRSYYPEAVQVGWMTLDAVEVMKDQDPISWKIARDEWESQEEEDGSIISFDNGSTYYWAHELEAFLEAQ